MTESIDQAIDAILPLLGERVCVLHPRQLEGVGGVGGGDIDCAVGGLDLTWPTRLTGAWRCCQCIHYATQGWAWILERNGEIVKIDALDDPSGYGEYGFPTSLALMDPGCDIPPATQAAYLTSKRIHKDIESVEEWRRIWRLARQNPHEYEQDLETIFGRRWGRRVSDAVLAGQAPGSAFRMRVVRRAHRLRRVARNARAVWPLLAGALRIVERVRYPTGLAVLIVGPDGAGKSTLADALEESSKGMFARVERWHWRPDILPNPRISRRPRADDSANPHGRPPHGKLLSFALLTYHWADFLVGGWVKLSVVRARSGLVLWERGWWDIAVDPRRYRLRVPVKVVLSLGRFLPRPDLVLVLEASSEAILLRKTELDGEELRRQMATWRRSLPTGLHQIPIDATAQEDVVAFRAREAVVEFLHRRALDRLHSGPRRRAIP